MLAATLCIAVLIAIVSPTITGRPLSEAGVDAADRILYVMAGIVAGYVGGRSLNTASKPPS